ncbi:hypothetical protein T09_8527 [Trichinella sp. T9]|nr:hypothetical protein T09_8527 [Trichinella sp. T9]
MNTDAKILDMILANRTQEDIKVTIHYDKPGMVAHTFNHSTWEAEAGKFLSLRPAWCTE